MKSEEYYECLAFALAYGVVVLLMIIWVIAGFFKNKK